MRKGGEEIKKKKQIDGRRQNEMREKEIREETRREEMK